MLENTMFTLILLVSDRTKARVLWQDIYDTLFLSITDSAEHFRKLRTFLINSLFYCICSGCSLLLRVYLYALKSNALRSRQLFSM